MLELVACAPSLGLGQFKPSVILHSPSVILRLRAPGCVSLALTFPGSFAPLQKLPKCFKSLQEVSKRSLEDRHSVTRRVSPASAGRVVRYSMFDKDPPRVNISRVKFRSRL